MAVRYSTYGLSIYLCSLVRVLLSKEATVTCPGEISWCSERCRYAAICNVWQNKRLSTNWQLIRPVFYTKYSVPFVPLASCSALVWAPNQLFVATTTSDDFFTLGEVSNPACRCSSTQTILQYEMDGWYLLWFADGTDGYLCNRAVLNFNWDKSYSNYLHPQPMFETGARMGRKLRSRAGCTIVSKLTSLKGWWYVVMVAAFTQRSCKGEDNISRHWRRCQF